MMSTPTVDDITPEKQAELDLIRPEINFPSSFKMSISTNDPALNLTEVLYYVSHQTIWFLKDSNAQKLRMQFFYSIMSLEPTKGFDLVMDSEHQQITV